jgi:hypothetical protein
MIRRFLPIVCLLITSTASASYYCMKSNQIVNEGDSMEKVEAACGKPTRINTKNEVTSIPVEVVEWVYMTRPVNPTKTSSYLPYLTVIFNNQRKVTEIRASQFAVPNGFSSATCKSGNLHVGDSAGAILSACGNPTIINRRRSSENSVHQMVEWIYEISPDLPPITFRFENGILSHIGQ